MTGSQEVKKFFEKRLDTFGPNFQAVQYSSIESQNKRYEILTEIVKPNDVVADVGCGVGHLYEFLKEKKAFQGKYIGLDFVESFVKIAQDRFKNESAEFHVHEIGSDPFPKDVDYYLLSGTFNNLMGDNKLFMFQTIKQMFEASRKAIAFNAMSTYVDFQVPDLFYSDPLEVVDFCKKNVSRKLTLRHDYLVKDNSIPFEYTIYLYKE